MKCKEVRMNKLNRKQEIKDKVKEIKQRQQNWLKQRAECKTNAGTNCTDFSVGSGRTRTKPVDNITEQKAHLKDVGGQNQPSSSAEQLISSNRSNARFQSWLKAKQTKENIGDTNGYSSETGQYQGRPGYNSSAYADNLYHDKSYRDHSGSGDVNILRVPSTRSPGFASPDNGFNSDDETGEITAATLLSPEDFDSRADNIIAKVKGDMRIRNSDRYDALEEVRKSRPALRSETVTVQQSDQSLSSHVCPTCDKLMLPPDCRPMLLIPCGHTLCSGCCRRTKYCGMCGCSVHSNTANLMLEKIITDYHTKQTHRQSSSKSATRSVPSKDYQEEFQNLLTRQEILTEELETIERNISTLDKKHKKDQQQVHSISKKEKQLELEIEKLNAQLAELVSHRSEYERCCDELEIQTKEEQNRLAMVQTSLKSVQQQIEKVKLLAENE